MNNSTIWDRSLAGGLAYSETASYEYTVWYPSSGLTDAEEYKTIRFNINQTALCIHYRYADLVLEGRVSHKTGAEKLAKSDLCAPIHNFCAHLFSSARFSLGGTEIENVSYVGQTASMMECLLAEQSTIDSLGDSYFYAPDTGDGIANSDTNTAWKKRRDWLFRPTEADHGRFVARLPLSTIFGAMENFSLISAYTAELEFIRGSNANLFYRAAASSKEYKVHFDSVRLEIPVAKPSKLESLHMLQAIGDSKQYLFSFRRRCGLMAPIPEDVTYHQLTICTESFVERPKFIIVAFQTAAKSDQTENYATYVHSSVETMHVTCNNHQLPQTLIPADFAKNDLGRFFRDAINWRRNYLQYPYATGHLNACNYRDLFPLYAFDISKDDETVQSNVVTVQLHTKFRVKTPANLRCHVAWVSDRTVSLYESGLPLKILKTTEALVE